MPTKKPSTKPRRVKTESSWPLAVCEHCKEEYRVDPNRAQGEHRQRFCSSVCANKVRADNQKGKPRVKKAVIDKTSKRDQDKTATAIKHSRMSKLPKTHDDLRAFRRTLNLSQRDFWKRIGVTQSGGSRYEQGRALPRPVAQLLEAVYVKGVTLERLAANDFAILEFLKTQHPDLYTSLDKAARGMERRL